MNAPLPLDESSRSLMTALNDEQVEIIQLLREEILELNASTQTFFHNIPEDPSQDLGEFSSHFENLGKAFELSGLAGLAYCSTRLEENFTLLIERQSQELACLVRPLKEWGELFLQYLDSILESADSLPHAKALNRLLADKGLPKPLNSAEKETLQTLFIDSDISKINHDSVTLPDTVTPEMASVEIDKNVHPDLLEGLLIELPNQAQQFEESINRFISHKDAEHLSRAQRVAHTIKGAANVVAIPGIANLCHFSEGLLESLAKNDDAVRQEVNDALVRSADCLCACAEYLNHESGPPEEIHEVLQLLLQCLKSSGKNRAEIEPAIEHSPSAEDLATNESAAQLAEANVEDFPDQIKQIPTTERKKDQNENLHAQSEKADPGKSDGEHERHISLPQKTARELLRLSGELQITNHQLGAKTALMEDSLAIADQQHLEIRKMAVELETLVQTQSAIRAASMKYKEDEIDPLEMERFSELHTFAHRLLELTTDSFESVGAIGGQLKEFSELMYRQGQLNSDNQDILLEMSLVPVNIMSSRLARCVRQTCRLTGKSARLEIKGEDLMVDSRVLQRMTDPLMHLIRNAIDHGLENDTDTRERRGKSAEGIITLSFRNRGDTLEITCSDDGSGFDYAQIKAVAVERGLIDEGTHAKEALLNQLVLMSGFSTRSEASQTSGRGIGLDSVFAEVKALKGNLLVESKPGAGTCFTITAPTSILTSHALLIACKDRQQNRVFAIASRAIKNIIYVDPKKIIERAEGYYYRLERTLKKDGDGTQEHYEIELQNLSEALNIFPSVDESIHALLVLERADGSEIGIGVEKIVASQDMVVKPLNRYSYQAPGVIGATILGDGSVSPVIDLQELPSVNISAQQRSVFHEARAKQILAERERYASPMAALIVDDSLSARRSLSQFVADMGMEVYTAKDGFDAISMMAEKKPNFMLVDLEMPRMNGLELTAHMRSREEYQDIPVIMITSRSTARHKQMARDAGVTTYLTKPWSDDELLNCIQQQIA